MLVLGALQFIADMSRQSSDCEGEEQQQSCTRAVCSDPYMLPDEQQSSTGEAVVGERPVARRSARRTAPPTADPLGDAQEVRSDPYMLADAQQGSTGEEGVGERPVARRSARRAAHPTADPLAAVQEHRNALVELVEASLAAAHQRRRDVWLNGGGAGRGPPPRPYVPSRMRRTASLREITVFAQKHLEGFDAELSNFTTGAQMLQEAFSGSGCVAVDLVHGTEHADTDSTDISSTELLKAA